jgi:hypothetical protein
MKANEAPEKLYVNFHFMETHPESHQPLVTKQGINKYDIEYTRTDTFIEKACEWLNKESESYVKTGGVGACVTYEGLDVKELVEDFEKYMKGK